MIASLPESFAQSWLSELTASVAMFTGLTITGSDRVADDGAMSRFTIWQRHVFARGDSASVWVACGADVPALLVRDAGDEDERVGLLREIIAQSLESTGQRLAVSDAPGLRCDAAHADDVPDTMPACVTVWRLTVDDQSFELVLAADAGLAALLETSPPESDATPADAGSHDSLVAEILERFEGVELPVRVVLGRATLRVRDVLSLTVGALIELDRQPSDPAEICVRDTVIARGEVVSIHGNYGVRVTAVMGERDRRTLALRGPRRPPVLDAHGRPVRVH